MVDISFGLVGRLAQVGGVTEPAVRLFLSILIGYPLAIIYRKYIYTQPKLNNHLFLSACGIAICIFNYGYQVYHSLLAVSVSYLLLILLKGTVLTTASFVFHMLYLLLGYYYTSTETYDITWTMPHCVLTLRLIGLAFDVADGQRPVSELSTANKKTYIARNPSWLEIAAYTYFPACFLVGPQFSFRRYESFINKEFDKYTGFTRAGTIRAAIGFAYLTVNIIGSGYFPDRYLVSDEFITNNNIFTRCMILGLWGRFTLYKYISCWLLTESVAICFGLTFAGASEDGEADWSGCSNIKLLVFENTTRFQHYIDSFNVQTNNWVAEYIYKRLKFLGNRDYSQFGTLLFLAVWHGLHSGYYMCFLMEFLVILCERQIEPIFTKSEKWQKIQSMWVMKPVIWILLKLYTLVGMGWSLAPLVLLTFWKWWHVYCAVWFIGFIVWLPWPIYKPILRNLLGSKRKNHKE